MREPVTRGELIGALLVSVIVVVVLAVGQLIHEHDDLAKARRTDYRICARQMEVRAAIILHDSANGQELALLHALPIFDCTPDLTGHAAVRLSDRAADAYLKHFDHGSALAPP